MEPPDDFLCASLFPHPLLVQCYIGFGIGFKYLKKNLNASKPSEQGEEISKRLSGNIGCKDKTSSWHLIGFPDDGVR